MVRRDEEETGSCVGKKEPAAVGRRPWAAPRFWGLLLVAALLMAFFPTCRTWAVAWLAPYLDAPSVEVMEIRVNTLSDPVAALVPLWRTGRTPQRLFVMRTISEYRHWRRAADWPAAIERLVTEAARDPDQEVRLLALHQLRSKAHPLTGGSARVAIHDPDPVIRFAGLKILTQCGGLADAESAVQLLRDPDPDVQVAAASALRQWTGRDFGIHDSTPATTRAKGVAEAELWWQQNAPQKDASSAGQTPGHLGSAMMARSRSESALAIRDLTGRRRQIREYIGVNRQALLIFWKTTDPISCRAMANLGRIAAGLPADFCLLPVCVDRVRTKHEGGDHVHGAAGAEGHGAQCSCEACGQGTAQAAHQHQAAHGGSLYEVGSCENGHVEVRLDGDVLCLWFVGGGNATGHAVRVPDSVIGLQVWADGERKSRPLVLVPKPDPLAEEIPGNCSQFVGSADWLGNVESLDACGTVTFKGVLRSFRIEHCWRHQHEHRHVATGNDVTLADLQQRLHRHATAWGLTCPQLIDDGQATVTYYASELPTYVLLDAQGRLCRRFVGVRNEAAFAAMLNALQER